MMGKGLRLRVDGVGGERTKGVEGSTLGQSNLNQKSIYEGFVNFWQ